MTKIPARLASYGLASSIAVLLIGGQVASELTGRPALLSRTGVMVEKFTRLATQEPLTFWPLVAYLLLLLGSHLLVMLAGTAVWRAACNRFKPNLNGRLLPLAGFLMLLVLMLVLWNIKRFPLSRAFPGSDVLLMQTASPLLFWGGTATVLLVALAGFGAMLASRRVAWPMIIVTVVLAIWAPAVLPDTAPAATMGSAHATRMGVVDRSSRPDIILIGIDSLRADFLPTHGYPDPTLSPHINALTRDMVMFDDTLTPMSRTFVSYMSLLSGQYPVRHGVRFNLYPRALFDHSRLLSHRLQEAGYVTAYSTDESRFANFDRSFGFDLIATPPTSVNDFLLGASYDSVVTNALSITPAGRWLMPHLHGNRAAYRQYTPTNHVDRVNDMIMALPKEQPAFIISHYCLPHWPYMHNVLDYGLAPPATPAGEWSDAPQGYLRALQATDVQVGQNLETLRTQGRLRNAIVIVFSDHGEGLSMERDKLEAVDADTRPIMGHGHGSDALGDTQQRVVLGMQRFVDGKPAWKPRHVGTPVSLIDIAPTLLSLLDVASEDQAFDGVAIDPAIDAPTTGNRMRFVETGLSGAVVETDKIDEDAVAREFAHLYSLQDDLRVEIDPAYLPSRLAAKQRGVYWKDQALVTIRGFTREGDCWVLADFTSRKVQCIRRPAEDPVATPMLQAACQHFSTDAGFSARWCRGANTPPSVRHAADSSSSTQINSK